MRDAARDVARRELLDADVDLDVWRRAQADAPSEAEARERCVRLRARAILRELPDGAAPLLMADAVDREAAADALARAASAWRATPDGRRHTEAELDAARRGTGWFALIYFATLAAVVGVVAWALGAC